MMGVGVVGCLIYGATCDAMCAIAASEMVWKRLRKENVMMWSIGHMKGL